MALRILLWTGVAHAKVEVTVRTELDAAAAVVLGHAHHLEQSTRGLPGIAVEIRRCFLLHKNRGDLPLLEHLVFEIIFPVLAKFRMEGEAEESVRSAFVKELTAKVSEQSFHISSRLFFQAPDFSRLMNNEKSIRKPWNLHESRQAGANVAGRMNKGMRESEFLAEEGRERNRFRQLGNETRHASIARERVLRLFEAGQVLDQIREFLERHRRLHSFRHEGNAAAALLLNVGGRNAHVFAIRQNQLDLSVRNLFHDPEVFVPGFCLDGRSTVTHRDRR